MVKSFLLSIGIAFLNCSKAFYFCIFLKKLNIVFSKVGKWCSFIAKVLNKPLIYIFIYPFRAI
ncbi:hypothetical protein GGTG_04852 [Gaeumannomyces tritici R3-111a-1]|uniref:Uncharacterized protein n=1 Tax=Gaeumannomyces tritici (strain R3-111a-1) TaxID=644352 RepID=J3NU98_GAET3|nr:hypothetical protein GGTG_04852 [Gaeumannomyces tritici R3-111a-1]EJT79769.1 hypothetical protein GGTG_04852 [Gaeumannomyces tritici R3-111a-1]